MLGLLLSLILLLIPAKVQAVYDPTSVANNKFGIHIADFNDISDVAPLVNSSGGDWGYVTLVASDNDRDSGRWQTMFNQMRRLHLVPLVRLATHPQGDSWAKPNADRFDEIVSFLNKLVWPTENRYVILYNEPNHANEWGNSIEPEEYVDLATQLAKKLKSASDDFFVLPAGLDASAQSDGASMNEAQYLEREFSAKPEFFSLIDGWTSHAYPNPAFSGSPNAAGRGTLLTYQWELSMLDGFGVTKKLPVFITETGWVHSQGQQMESGVASTDTVGSFLQTAAAGVWKDPQIVAVTPFVFSYQGQPFDHFSWKKLGSGEYYSQYYAYKDIPKQAGEPKQKEAYQLLSPLFPKTLVANSTYTVSTDLRNVGEGILTATDDYDLMVNDHSSGFTFFSEPLPQVEPGEKGTIMLHMRTPQKSGKYTVDVTLRHHSNSVSLESKTIDVVPPPSLGISVQLGWKKTSQSDGVSVLVYNKNNEVIQKFEGLRVVDGLVSTGGLQNVVPGESYRIVTLVPFYLPRQTIAVIQPKITKVATKRFLPLDVNGDGAFTFTDIVTLFTSQPHTIIGRFIGP